IFGFTKSMKGSGAGFELSGETPRQDLAACRLFLYRKAGRAPADLRPQFGERSLAPRLVLQKVHLIHEVVAARSRGLPALWQRVVAEQDLLNNDIGRLVWIGSRSARRKRLEPLAECAAIASRLRQAVDVIDAHAVDQCLGIEPENQSVDAF